MKKYLILICSLLVFSSSFAQGGFQAKKVRIGLTVTPFYSYRTLQAPTSFQEVVDSLNSRAGAKVGYSAGLNLIIGLSKRIYLETGAQYTDRGSKLRDINFSDASGNIVGKAEQKFQENYIDIPVKLNLNILNKRFRLFVSGGLSANVFIFKQIKTEVQYFDGTVDASSSRNSSDNKQVNLSALAGVGIEYHTLKVFSFRFEPIFSYSLLSSTKGSVEDRPYSVGANFGLYFGF